jgi:hypothetical protein
MRVRPGVKLFTVALIARRLCAVAGAGFGRGLLVVEFIGDLRHRIAAPSIQR